jgi:hypothetical protein
MQAKEPTLLEVIIAAKLGQNAEFRNLVGKTGWLLNFYSGKFGAGMPGFVGK